MSSNPTSRHNAQRLFRTLLPTSKTSIHTILLCLFFLTTVGSSLWSYGRQYIGIDFYQFWVVPTAQAKGEDVHNFAEPQVRIKMGEAYYATAQTTEDWRFKSVADARRELETLSTPFMYTVFSLFTSNNYEFDYCFYQIFATAAFLLSLLAFCIFLGFSWAEATLFVGLVSSFYEPLLSDIRVANVNRLNVAFLCLCCYLTHYKHRIRTRRIAAFLLGAFIPYKPVLIGSTFLFVLARAIQQKWRDLIADGACVIAGGLFGLIAATIFFSDIHVWFMWMREFSAMGDTMISLESGNHSPAQALSEYFGISRNITGMGLAAIVLATVSLAWFWQANRTKTDLQKAQLSYQIDISAILVGVLLFFSASKLVWLHYQLMLLPLQAYLLRPIKIPGDGEEIGNQHEASYRTTATRILSLTSIVALGFNGWQVWFGDGTIFLHRQVIAVGLSLVFAACLLELSAKRQ